MLDLIRNEKVKNNGIYLQLKLRSLFSRYYVNLDSIKSDEKSLSEINNIIRENRNYFQLFDYVIDNALEPLSVDLIKKYHLILKKGTFDETKYNYEVGNYKKYSNEIDGFKTSHPNYVDEKMNFLLTRYNRISEKTLETIIEFHVCFEQIHPFQDGNGRIGRIIMLKECLKHNIIPFIIEEKFKYYYFNGLRNYNIERGWLIDTIKTCQDEFLEKYIYNTGFEKEKELILK